MQSYIHSTVIGKQITKAPDMALKETYITPQVTSILLLRPSLDFQEIQ